jgi:hypothetical protein
MLKSTRESHHRGVSLDSEGSAVPRKASEDSRFSHPKNSKLRSKALYNSSGAKKEKRRLPGRVRTH